MFVTNSLRLVASELGINVKMDALSKLDLKLGRITHPGQWAVKISEALEANEYINPYSGHSIFRENEFSSRNIKLYLLRSHDTPYRQRRDGFVNGLSIIDVMMWNSNAEIVKMLAHDFDILIRGESGNFRDRRISISPYGIPGSFTERRLGRSSGTVQDSSFISGLSG
jgi:hypothetical protein